MIGNVIVWSSKIKNLEENTLDDPRWSVTSHCFQIGAQSADLTQDQASSKDTTFRRRKKKKKKKNQIKKVSFLQAPT